MYRLSDFLHTVLQIPTQRIASSELFCTETNPEATFYTNEMQDETKNRLSIDFEGSGCSARLVGVKERRRTSRRKAQRWGREEKTKMTNDKKDENGKRC